MHHHQVLDKTSNLRPVAELLGLYFQTRKRAMLLNMSRKVTCLTLRRISAHHEF
uniref:Uncharacterized protein n=1 Tax=Arundo donax TaxID=35708 RepID=A0A0A9G9S9_ARUDO